MALLEVVTRCYKRPNLLARNVESLRRQSDPDYLQEFIVDDVGLGIGASYQRMAHHIPLGDWIWILDDDDECVHDDLVADVRRIAKEEPQTGCIMVRMDHGGGLGVQPDNAHWHGPPVEGHIGVSAYIVRRDIWRQNARVFSLGRYQSDFDFACALWSSRLSVHWLDVVASRCQRISHGVPE
jgi:hypothetical protein